VAFLVTGRAAYVQFVDHSGREVRSVTLWNGDDEGKTVGRDQEFAHLVTRRVDEAQALLDAGGFTPMRPCKLQVCDGAVVTYKRGVVTVLRGGRRFAIDVPDWIPTPVTMEGGETVQRQEALAPRWANATRDVFVVEHETTCSFAIGDWCGPTTVTHVFRTPR
jgi:hypothetical protein